MVFISIIRCSLKYVRDPARSSPSRNVIIRIKSFASVWAVSKGLHMFSSHVIVGLSAAMKGLLVHLTPTRFQYQVKALSLHSGTFIVIYPKREVVELEMNVFQE